MITVFTPTYNRAHTLKRLYDSLLAQTSKRFEWLVVDDGSTDNTEEFFKQIKSTDSNFEIVYVKQSNGGKHRAINKGVSLARGEVFLIVDSDDYLIEDAIEKIETWLLHLPNTGEFAGVAGLKGYSLSKAVGGRNYKAEFIDASNMEREKYNLIGDKTEVYFTQVLKKYPFPEFEGENFITEEVVWNKIASDGYKIRWYNEIIYICEYMEDGLTKNGNAKFRKNPKGTLYWARQEISIFKGNCKRKFIAVNCYYDSVKDYKSIKEIAIDLGVSRAFVITASFLAKIKRALRKRQRT